MSDGFRSAEIGAPASTFTFTSGCTTGCSALTGHALDCAMMRPVSIPLEYTFEPTGFVVHGGAVTVWPIPAPAPASCPHCGGALGNATLVAGPTTFSTTT